MIGIGINTGTSADAIDIAIVEFNGMFPNVSIRLLWSGSYNYPVKLKELFTKLVENKNKYSQKAWFSMIGEFDANLGMTFANVAIDAIKTSGIKEHAISFIGSHGQTVWHKPLEPSKNNNYGVTIQLGNPSILAEKTGIPVIADFRGKDIANHGQGAPLSPVLHFQLFRELAPVGVLNIGGIANLTVIPSNKDFLKVYGFDTGPGNRLIDIAVRTYTRGKYCFDKNGGFAQKGIIISEKISSLMRDSFVRKPPPKSTGREYYNEAYIRSHSLSLYNIDTISTLTYFTAYAVAFNIKRFVNDPIKQLVVCGGGGKNKTIIKQLSLLLNNMRITSVEKLGYRYADIEPMLFSYLGYLGFNRIPINLKHITGSDSVFVPGAIYYP